MQPEHGIAHTATDQKRLISGLVQAIQDFQRAVGNFVSGDVVGGAGNDLWNCVLRVPAIIQVIFRLSIEYGAV